MANNQEDRKVTAYQYVVIWVPFGKPYARSSDGDHYATPKEASEAMHGVIDHLKANGHKFLNGQVKAHETTQEKLDLAMELRGRKANEEGET